MLIVHVATALSGGAGIGMLRYHEAVLSAGVESRIIVGRGATGADTRVALARTRPASVLRRMSRRAGIQLDPAMRVRAEVARLDSAAHRQPSYELFSPPYSECTPEAHPWMADADVLNLHWVAGTVDWPRFFRRVQKPAVITLHDQQPYLGGFHYARDADNNPWLMELDARVRTIKQSALGDHRCAVIGNSQWNTHEAKASGFFPAGTPFHTIYYPLDTTVYAPRPKDAARAAFGIEPGRTVIGFACENLDNPRKGLDVLLGALQMLPASLAAQTSLLSFGREPTRQFRERMTMPWLHLGYLESDAAKAAVYSAMDVFAVPSRAEAFGLTAIEALACGTSVIGSDTGGLPEALFNGEAGILFETGNPQAMAGSLVSLLEASGLRARLAAAGRKLVVDRHAPAKLAQQYIAVLQSALG